LVPDLTRLAANIDGLAEYHANGVAGLNPLKQFTAFGVPRAESTFLTEQALRRNPPVAPDRNDETVESVTPSGPGPAVVFQ
jgi:hypothetical protein